MTQDSSMPQAPFEFWPAGTERWYPAACAWHDYPERLLAPYFDLAVRPEDEVLDLGCGFGLSSLALARRCRRVWALDNSERAINYLSQQVELLGIDNVCPRLDTFPCAGLSPCDVTIMLYVGGVLNTTERAQAVLDVTRREGLFLTNSDQHPEQGVLQELRQQLNPQPPGKKRGVFISGQEALEILRPLCAKTELYQLTHDFGQPCEDLEDAVNFALCQLRAGEDKRDLVSAALQGRLPQRNGKLYIENQRTSCLIHFVK